MPKQEDETAVIDTPVATATPTPAPQPDRGDVVKEPTPPPAPAPALGTDADDDSADPATGKPRKQGSDHVPIGRFNEVNEAKKALERENAELKARVSESAATTAPVATPAPAPTFDEDSQEKAYADALLEGDTDKALKIRKTINTHIREQSIATATEAVRGELAAKEVGQSLQEASEQAVKDFPYLDTEAGSEALELIVASRDRRISQGVPAGEALRKAVEAIAPKFAPTAAVDTKDRPKDQRPANALARGAADSVAQPPAVQAGIGNRATAVTVNVKDLTEEQFDALSPEEKKKLRGD